MPDTLMVVPTRADRPGPLIDSLKSIADQLPRPWIRVVTSSDMVPHVRKVTRGLADECIAETRAGLSAAINTGWQDLREFKYTSWLGDDDLLEPQSLCITERILRASPQSSFVYGGLRWMDGAGQTKRITVPLGIEHRLMSYGANLVWQPGSLYRTEAVAAAGLLDESLRYAMDLDLFLKLMKVGTPKSTRRVLAAYRVHSDTLSARFVSEQLSESNFAQDRASLHPKFLQRARPAAREVSRVVFRITSRKLDPNWSLASKSTAMGAGKN